VIPKAVESLDDLAPAPLPERITRRFASGLGNDTFTFLYVSTGEPHKNHKTLVSAMDLLRSSGLKVRAALTLTEDALVRMGGSSAASLVQDGYILPLGWVPKEHLRCLYDACHACAMPSVLETLSSAHLEAMAWGKPQVCADLPYARDLCGDAALYAAAEDPAQWAAQMQTMLHDEPLRSRLVTAACERMQAYPPSWQEVARKVRAFLAEVVAATRKSCETPKV
jgi:glycosyltransferase involved in cell wall biosynthesis